MIQTHHAAVALARGLAVLGGAVLSALILLTGLSILGRAANSALNAAIGAGLAPGLAQGLIDAGVGAIPGAFELVEAGMAFCIFAFLPYCQLTAGHAAVEVFTDPLPARAKRVLVLLIEAVFAAVLVLIAVQLSEALERALRSGQTSFILQFPLWWSYAASLAMAALAALAGVYMAVLRGYEAVTGRTLAGPPA